MEKATNPIEWLIVCLSFYIYFRLLDFIDFILYFFMWQNRERTAKSTGGRLAQVFDTKLQTHSHIVTTSSVGSLALALYTRWTISIGSVNFVSLDMFLDPNRNSCTCASQCFQEINLYCTSSRNSCLYTKKRRSDKLGYEKGRRNMLSDGWISAIASLSS